MSEFQDENDEVVEVVDDFDDVGIDSELVRASVPLSSVDARRKLESLLEEKRLREELDYLI